MKNDLLNKQLATLNVRDAMKVTVIAMIVIAETRFVGDLITNTVNTTVSRIRMNRTTKQNLTVVK